MKHEGLKNYNCKECSNTFGFPQALRNHIRNMHRERKLEKCPYCHKIFKQYFQFKKHVRVKHEGLEK